jgi:hypothetical protein
MKPTLLLLLAALASASTAFAQTPPQADSAPNAWQPLQQTDVARAFTFTRFSLTGKFRTPPRDAAPNRPTLVVDCIPDQESHTKGKFLAASLQVGTAMKIIYVEPEEIHGVSYYPKVAVRIRVDGAEQREKWSAASDKTSVSIPKAALKKILRARSVAISARDEHGAAVAMQFDMQDPASVEASCSVN